VPLVAGGKQDHDINPTWSLADGEVARKMPS
jgi:hypothetical protein